MMLKEDTLLITLLQDQLIIFIHYIIICYINHQIIFHTEPVVYTLMILIFVIYIIS